MKTLVVISRNTTTVKLWYQRVFLATDNFSFHNNIKVMSKSKKHLNTNFQSTYFVKCLTYSGGQVLEAKVSGLFWNLRKNDTKIIQKLWPHCLASLSKLHTWKNMYIESLDKDVSHYLIPTRGGGVHQVGNTPQARTPCSIKSRTHCCSKNKNSILGGGDHAQYTKTERPSSPPQEILTVLEVGPCARCQGWAPRLTSIEIHSMETHRLTCSLGDIRNTHRTPKKPNQDLGGGSIAILVSRFDTVAKHNIF